MQINPFASIPAFTRGADAKDYLEARKLAPELVDRIDDIRRSMAGWDGTSLDYDPRPDQVVFVDRPYEIDRHDQLFTGEIQKDEVSGEVEFSAASADLSYQFTYKESQGSKTYESWTPNGNLQVCIDAGCDEWNISRQTP